MIDLNLTMVAFIIFLVYCISILFTMFYISSLAATIIMLLFPVIMMLSIPDKGIEFLAHRQIEFFNGTVALNNLHILMLIWAALFGMIFYTEFISWYLSIGTTRPSTVGNVSIFSNIPSKAGAFNRDNKPDGPLMGDKIRQALDLLAIDESEGSELIDMAKKYRENFSNLRKDNQSDEGESE